MVEGETKHVQNIEAGADPPPAPGAVDTGLD
jgi:hypothetical protein